MIKIIADSNAFGTRLTTLRLSNSGGDDPHELAKYISRNPLARGILDAWELVATATEWDTILEDAPETEHIKKALAESEPKEFEPGDWHLPGYSRGFWQDMGDGTDAEGNTLEVAQALSLLEYDTAEHQATPMGLKAVNIDEGFNLTFDEGVTHFDRKGKIWSDNLVNWVQLKQMGSYQDKGE